jgi:DNA-binding CsgD family transcriptional regulator
VAALQAAELRMAEAAEHAAWAAGLAADRDQWNVALAGYHDAARYGAARTILVPLREAATHVDGTFAWCLIDHAAALATRDPVALDEVARRFETHCAMLLAAEAAAEAALAHTAGEHSRPARSSAGHAALLWAQCEGAVSPWLAGATLAVPLTGRERHIAALAAGGDSDAAIADRLGISTRTVQTHLGRVYLKLGINSRADLHQHLGG